jgi:hypothetical protein
MDKLMYETVYEYINDKGLELISKEYNKETDILEIKCSKGHVFRKSYSNFKVHPFCGKCYKEQKKLKQYEEIKELLESTGGKIVSTNYTKCEDPIDFICSCGRNYSMPSVKLKVSGGYCPLCRYERTANTRRYTYEEILGIFNKTNCVLISEEYITGEPLEFICGCGNVHKKLLPSFVESPMCDECGHKKSHITRTYSYEKLLEFANENDCVLLTQKEDCKGKKGFAEFICKCGNPDKKRIKNFLLHPYCMDCSKKISSEKQKIPFLEIINYVKSKGCLLLSSEEDYKNNQSELEFVCACGNIFETKFALFKYENSIRCYDCYLKSVSGENSRWWTGGSSERDRAKSSVEYREWRKNVFKRDNYVCQCCGKKSGKLNAHHIENFATNVEKRTELDNGITLCEDCHSISKYGSFHWVYGSRNNNKQQLDEYIEKYKNGVFQVCQLANLIK